MYPEEIELPEAKDFCKGQMTSGNRCCMIGWRRVLLPDLTEVQVERFDKIANDIADEMALKRNRYYWSPALSDINDHKDNTKKQLAEWFRRTIEKLGYYVK